ncbi:GNAT family N-acetyltransferase [Bacillus salipaludis]|uniref:GNAT family N-acetyltransferase n=1 Tax=Bacillus salipaludis TaxID=2547811 RepID=UPI003D1E62B9
MNFSLNNLTVPEVIKATQDNMIGLMHTWSELSDELQVIEDESSFRIKSTLKHPLFNTILKTRVDRDVHAFVESIVNEYKSQQTPFLWRIWDHDTPVEIGSVLLENGAQQVPGTILMAINLDSFQPLTQPLPELTIQTIGMKRDAVNFSQCACTSFGIHKQFLEPIGELIYKEDPNIVNFVGYVDDTVVSTATLFYHNGIAGIYNVATLPDFQGKGTGMEIMTALLLKAKLDGYHTAILHATPAGLRLYEKLGFIKYGEMKGYLFI